MKKTLDDSEVNLVVAGLSFCNCLEVGRWRYYVSPRIASAEQCMMRCCNGYGSSRWG